MMLTLNSPHFLSLFIALSFSFLVHFSLTGFTKKIQTFLIAFVLFPVSLMAFSLFIPQDFLQYMSYLLILIGFFLAIYKFPKRLKTILNVLGNMETKEKWIVVAVIFYLLSFFMNATIFQDGGSIQDALVYHLEGPKEWALFLDGAKFNANNPTAFTTSYYDYYYYFLFLLAKPLFLHFAPLASTHYEFLSYTMLLSAQTFTGIVALVYIPILILRFSTSLGLYKYLAVFFLFGIRLITWSWVLPKNDAYSFLCFLLGLSIFNDNYIKKRNNNDFLFLFLSALLIGIGTASKLTNAYVVIFSLLFLTIFNYQDVSNYIKKIGLKKSILIASVGMGLGTAIFLIRNFIYTGNPFFPIAKFGFPNIYLSDYAYRPAMYSEPGSWMEALVKIKLHLWSQSQLFLLLVLGLMMTRTRNLSLFYVCMVVYMAKQTGPMFGFRMTTIFLVLALILFIIVIKELNLLIKFRSNKIYSWIFIITILVFSKIQIEKLVKYPLKYYSVTTGDLIKNKVDYWDILLKSNLDNRNDKKYIFAPTLEIFPYFSRYPAISMFDSVPKYRYNYFAK